MGGGFVVCVLKLMRNSCWCCQHRHQQQARCHGYHNHLSRNAYRHILFVTGNGGAEAKEGPPAPRAHPSHRLRDSDYSLFEICLTGMCVSGPGDGKQERLPYTSPITQEVRALEVRGDPIS